MQAERAISMLDHCPGWNKFVFVLRTSFHSRLWLDLHTLAQYAPDKKRPHLVVVECLVWTFYKLTQPFIPLGR